MSHAAVIRRIRADDGAAYRAIRLRGLAGAPLAFGTTLEEAEARPEPWWDERVAACAEGDAFALFVAETSDGLCGLIGGMQSQTAGHVDVISMWVDPEVRRLGIAWRLLYAVETWAAAQGVTVLDLWVTDGNVPAITLYERYGFTFTGEATPHPSHPGVRELAMRRALARYIRGGTTR